MSNYTELWHKNPVLAEKIFEQVLLSNPQIMFGILNSDPWKELQRLAREVERQKQIEEAGVEEGPYEVVRAALSYRPTQ